MNLVVKAQTALALGLFNLFRVFKYRIGVKTGLNSVQKLTAQLPVGCFFSQDNRLLEVAQSTRQLKLNAFGHLDYIVDGLYPDWFYSPLTHKRFECTDKVWYQIPDFDESLGDIKGVWEASRFDWLIDYVLQERFGDDASALVELDLWLNNWCHLNPAYLGPNWKCGQEASIRVMHVVAALIGLNRIDQVNENLLAFIEVHLQRIAPTIDYAIAQDNNHGTSEAVALFVGGAILNSVKKMSQYQVWQNLGRKWLENRARKLIMQDGGFSQYSVNYHRVMLDSYCLAEIVRQKLSLPPFSKKMYQQLGKATDWLYILTQENGDAPNLGANDGARLIPVTQTDYRDFRPSVQLASTLFYKHSYYQSSDNYDQSLLFFNINKLCDKHFSLPSKNKYFNTSGLITAYSQGFFVAFKLPIFKFRPSQCDALHLDVWWQGENILRDGGTYSYNSTAKDLDYFSGVASHNTVQFDQHLQMPRLSRFLFGAWLKPISLKYQAECFECGYQDYWRAQHHRSVKLDKKQIMVKDTVKNFKEQAVLRWRLTPDNWQLNGHILSNGKIQLEINSSSEVIITLTQGEESRYYYQKTFLPVLEVLTMQPTTIFTLIKDIT